MEDAIILYIMRSRKDKARKNPPEQYLIQIEKLIKKNQQNNTKTIVLCLILQLFLYEFTVSKNLHYLTRLYFIRIRDSEAVCFSYNYFYTTKLDHFFLEFV